MGEKGFSAVSHITWDTVVAKILSAIELPQKQVRKWEKSPAIKRPIKVVITDNHVSSRRWVADACACLVCTVH